MNWLFCLSILVPSILWAQTPTKTSSPTGDIDMTQFKNLTPPKRQGRIKIGVSCKRPDGTVLKQGDVGFKECIEVNENRVMNQPQPPEATPYDPRAN